MDIVVSKLNDVWIKISAEPAIIEEIGEHFTFDVPGAKFTKQFKNGFWDGKKRLLDRRGNKLPAGLAKHLAEFARLNKYTIDFGNIDVEEPMSFQETYDFVKSLDIHSKNTKIQARDYQLVAFRKAIQEKRIILLSPTSSGKSLIIYFIIRYLQTLFSGFSKKIILVVPRQSLVEQMYKDFQDYSSNDQKWNVEDNCHRIYQGHEKETDKQVIITTYHSLKDMDPLIYNSTCAIIADETHSYKSDILTELFGQFKKTPYRIGTTGTLQDAKAHRLVLEGTFGPAYNVVSVQKLTSEKKVAKTNIKCLVLHHDRDSFESYEDEISYLILHKERNRFIRNLALSLEGNTLILVNYIDDHLLPLVEDLEKYTKGREIFVVHGEVNVQEREEIRSKIEESKNSITVASAGVFSEGVNIKRIHNIILAFSLRSAIRLRQIIGRGLRLGDDKDQLTFYDVADKFEGSKTFRQYLDRLKIYDQDGHPYKEYKIRID